MENKKYLDRFRYGIFFENNGLFLKWHTPFSSLKKIGNPEIDTDSGRLDIIWKDTVLLDGLKGDWHASSLNSYYLTSISYYQVGDDISLKNFDVYEAHLTKLLGNPVVDGDRNGDVSLNWENKYVSVFLYLFEMHCYRLSLSINYKKKPPRSLLFEAVTNIFVFGFKIQSYIRSKIDELRS